MDKKIRSACFDCYEHLTGTDKGICAPKCEKRLIPISKIGPARKGSVKQFVKKSEQKEPDLKQNNQNNEHTTYGPEPEGRICSNEACPKKGIKQPIDEFKTASSNNLYEICKTCRESNLKSENPDSDKKEITIDFKDHSELYDQVLELAKERLRAPNKMILWILIKIYEKGWDWTPG